MKPLLAFLILLTLRSSLHAQAVQTNSPPLGRDSWSSFAQHVTDAGIRATAESPQTLTPLVPFPNGAIPTGLGVCVHHLDESPSVLKMMYDTGFRYLRIDLKWSEIETSRGVYKYSPYDRFMTNATKAGLKIMFILDYQNPLYDGGFSPYTDAGTTAFAKYAVASVAHFEHNGILWEMYNEPTGFWKHPKYPELKKDSDADIVAPLYAAMAIKAGALIKAKFPNEIVVGPALPRIESKDKDYFHNTMSFVQQTLQAGAGNYWDYFTAHPYRSVAPEDAFDDMATLRSKIAAYSPLRLLPLADTEWGYSSVYFDKNGKMSYADAEILKAKRLARALIVDQIQGMPFTFVYDWMDDGADQKDLEHNFGLVQQYPVGSSSSIVRPLPAFHAVKTLVSTLYGLKYDNRIDTGDAGDYIVKFVSGDSKSSRTVWVCWNRDGLTHDVMVPVGTKVPLTLILYDGSSEIIQTSGANGYRCTTNEAPQYFVTSGEN